MDWREVFFATPEPPRALTQAELKQAFRLGVLPAIVSREACHGYGNGCTCSVCAQVGVSIQENGFTPDGLIRGRETPKQPWEPVKRAA